MHAPQITLLALWVLGLGMTLARDGQPRTGNHSFGTNVVGLSIVSAILWWGGWWG